MFREQATFSTYVADIKSGRADESVDLTLIAVRTYDFVPVYSSYSSFVQTNVLSLHCFHEGVSRSKTTAPDREIWE